MDKIISDDIVIVVESGIDEKIGSVHYFLLNIKYKDYANININIDPKLPLKELEKELDKLSIEKRFMGIKTFPYKKLTINERIGFMISLLNNIQDFWLTNVYMDTLGLTREEFRKAVEESMPEGIKKYDTLIPYIKRNKTNKKYYDLAKMYCNYFRLKEVDNIIKTYDIKNMTKFLKEDKTCPLIRRY